MLVSYHLEFFFFFTQIIAICLSFQHILNDLGSGLEKSIYAMLGSREVSMQFHFIDEKAGASNIEQFAQDRQLICGGPGARASRDLSTVIRKKTAEGS